MFLTRLLRQSILDNLRNEMTTVVNIIIKCNLLILKLLRTVECPDAVLTSVVLSNSGRMLFAGTTMGTIRSFKFPLTVPGEWVEYQAHGAPITKVNKSSW